MRIISDYDKIRISVEVRNSYGRPFEAHILIPKDTSDEQLPTINLPATGNMALESVPEFIEAITLAVLLAKGEIKE